MFDVIMVNNFLKLINYDKSWNYEIQKSLFRILKKTKLKQMHTHQHVILKLPKYKGKGITLNVARENKHEIQKEKINGLPYISFQKVCKLENKEATSLIFQNTEREVKQRTENYLVKVIIY